MNQGRFDAKVLVKDLKNQKSAILYMKANAVFNEKLRVDLTSTLGGYIAGIVLNGNDLKYVLMRQKKFYSGPANSESLRSVLAIPLNPQWLYSILFDRPLLGSEWSCASDSANVVQECRNQNLQLQITWSERVGSRKTVLIEHERGSVQMNFQTFKSQLDSRSSLFTIEIPENFTSVSK